MNDKDINNLKEMLIDFNEYSTDYTKTRCRELEETTKNTLKVIERLNNIINELEKGIKENIEELEEHQLSRDRIDEDKEILRFLQELKGSE